MIITIVLCAFAGVITLGLAVWGFLYLTIDKPNLDELSFEARELPAEEHGDPEDHKAYRTMGVRR